MSKNVGELLAIGYRIKEAIETVWKSGLSIEELEEFEEYINRQETVTPILNPNFIQKHGFKIFDKSKERIELLKPIIKLKEKEEEGK